MNILQETMKSLTLGPAASFACLTVFPLLAERKDERGYLTLDDALAMWSLKITETSEAGTVTELLLNNEGNQPVLLLDGEELTGAKQNRVVNLTVLAPAGKKIVIPVSCVEAGRWSARSEEFASADRVMFSNARRNKVASVSVACVMDDSRQSNQREVWGDIADRFNDLGVHSPTSEMGEIFRTNARKMNEYVRAFQPLANQVGAVFALGGSIRGLELFDHHRTLCDLLPKLIRSYALDAMEIAASAHALPGEAEAKTFISDVVAADCSRHDAIGLGNDLRLTGSNLAGGALVVDERVVHLCAFREESEGNRGVRDQNRSNQVRQEGRIMRSDWRRGRRGKAS